MLFLIVGLFLLAAKILDMQFASTLSWYMIMLPFALTVVWWWISDYYGWTERSTMRRYFKRKKKSAFAPGSKYQTLFERLTIRGKEIQAYQNEEKMVRRWEQYTDILKSSFDNKDNLDRKDRK